MVLHRNIDGKRVIALPIDDLFIVREEEVESRRSKHIKQKSSQLK